MKQQNDYFRIVSDEEQLIAMRFRKPGTGDTPVKLLTPAAIAQMLSYGRPALSSRKVGQVMRKLGFKWSHTRNGNVYHVFELTPEQSQAVISSRIASQQTDTEKITSERELPF